MRPFWAALLAATLLVSDGSVADDHLAPPAAVRAALARAAAEREANLAVLARALSTPAAGRAADRIGVDLGQVRRALPVLSDAEARDLAARAAALQEDPDGRLLGFVGDLVVITLLVLLILVLIGVVAVSSITD